MSHLYIDFNTINERTVFVCRNLYTSYYHDIYEDKIEMGYYFWTNIYNNIDDYIEQLKKRLDLYFKKLMEENEKILHNYQNI